MALFGGGRPKIEYIVAGLGNPGAEYEKSRHNAGFGALDIIADKESIRVKRASFRALVGDGVIAGRRVLLMKPQTYMNDSGSAVRAAADYYKVPPERVIVIFDDISFNPGELRVKRKGSAGGHNGIKSIIEHLGTEDFPRIKIGVGAKPHPDADLASHVLGTPNQKDREAIRSAQEKAAEALEAILRDGIDEAMQRYN